MGYPPSGFRHRKDKRVWLSDQPWGASLQLYGKEIRGSDSDLQLQQAPGAFFDHVGVEAVEGEISEIIEAEAEGFGIL